MTGAKFLSVAFLALGILGIAKADIKQNYSIFPITCGETRTDRTNSTKYCLNNVAGSTLEVFSIKELKNGITVVSSEYYLVANSYDLPRQTSDGLAQVLVPAKRIMRLEKAEVTAPEEGQAGYTRLASVTLKDKGTPGRQDDKRKQLVLSEPDTETKTVRAGNAGLTLKSGENFDEPFTIDALKAEPLTRGQ